MPEVNLLAVLVTIVANVLIGTLWFGPLFGKKWMLLVGLTQDDMKSGNFAPMIGSLAGAALSAFIFGVLTQKMEVDSMRGYLESAFWMWLGFTAITSFTNANFAGRAKSLWAIESFYWLLTSLMMAVIFALIVL